jgi:phospholipase B1
MSQISGYDVEEYKNFVANIAKDEQIVLDYFRNVKRLETLDPNYFNYTPFASPGYKFICDHNLARSSERPTSVHKLRPGDIQVIGALGDSITAACGARAKTILGMLVEFRGRSWSIGGQEELIKILAVPNILKLFNPTLFGFSKLTDDSLLMSKGVGLNVAVSGSFSDAMLLQAKHLVANMKQASKHIDFQEDWKLVTLFIGGNDLCLMCEKPDYFSPENYVKNVRDALDYLHENLPRAFVNVVQVINITHIRETNRGLVCSLIHQALCPCAAYPKDDAAEALLQRYIQEYRFLTRKLIDSGRYDTRDDFTVVLQPFFEHLQPERLPDNTIDYTYLAPDCFHFSPKGHGK